MIALWLGLDWSQRPPDALIRKPADMAYPDYFAQYIRPALPVADGFDFPLHPPDREGVFV